LALKQIIGLEDALAATASDIDRLMDRLLPAVPADKLREAMRYAVLGQGKRLRPFLVMQSASLFSVDHHQALRVAAALECVHCYSLVHDDLPAMDDDDLRRGQPTLHKKFDEATAILAGDALLTFAFEILSDAATHPDATIRSALVLALAKASGEQGMVGGQMLDLAAEELGFATAAEISAMQDKKTGALFAFACEAGAILGGGDAKALRHYAKSFGLAFQIHDDVLDVTSDAATLGKATQKDKDKGKATFVDLLGLEGAKAEANRLAQDAMQAIEIYGNKVVFLKDVARFAVTRRK
jgi:farnesyl diphosphate synthase